MKIGPLGIVSIEPIYPMNNSSNNIYFPLNVRKKEKIRTKFTIHKNCCQFKMRRANLKFSGAKIGQIKFMQNESIFIVQIQYCRISIPHTKVLSKSKNRKRERENRQRLNSKSRMSEVSLSVYYLSLSKEGAESIVFLSTKPNFHDMKYISGAILKFTHTDNVFRYIYSKQWIEYCA